MNFDHISTEAMRTACRNTGTSRIGWDEWTREMLIAFVRNRPDLCAALPSQPIKTAAEAAYHE